MEQLAKVQVNSLTSGSHNPNARYSQNVNLEDLPTHRLQAMLKTIRSERAYLQDRMEVLKALSREQIGELHRHELICMY
jgi:hypothetical protein